MLKAFTYTVAIIGLILFVVIPATLFEAYVIVKMWGWFIVPLGMKPIGMASAVGISSLLGLFTHQYRRVTKKDKFWPLAYPFMASGATLLLGYIAHGYIK